MEYRVKRSEEPLEHGLVSKLLGRVKDDHKYIKRIENPSGSKNRYTYIYKDAVNKAKSAVSSVKSASKSAVEAGKELVEKKYKYLLKAVKSDGTARYFYDKEKVDNFMEKYNDVLVTTLNAKIVEVRDYHKETDIQRKEQAAEQARERLNTKLQEYGSEHNDLYKTFLSEKQTVKNEHDSKISKIQNSILPKSAKETLIKRENLEYQKTVSAIRDKQKRDAQTLYDKNKTIIKTYSTSASETAKEYEAAKKQEVLLSKGDQTRTTAVRQKKDSLIDVVSTKALTKVGQFSADIKALKKSPAESAKTDSSIKTTHKLVDGVDVYFDDNGFEAIKDAGDGSVGNVIRYVFTKGDYEADKTVKNGSVIYTAYERFDSSNEVNKLTKIENSETLDQSQEAVNPNYTGHKDLTYSTNCQYCTTAYVMRRMGYDVEAKPATSNYDGTTLSSSENFNGAVTLTLDHNMTTQEAVNAFTKQVSTYGNESFGELGVLWKLGSGHSMVWSVEDGEVVIRDTQVGAVYKHDALYDIFAYTLNGNGGITFTRLDNTIPNDNVLTAVQAKKVKK